MIRTLVTNRKLSVFALFFAGLAMAVVVGVVGGNHQAAAAGECGSSYSLSRTYPILKGTERTGTLELYWSNTTKKNCAINRCYGTGSNGCGISLFRAVKLRLSSQSVWPTDTSSYNSPASDQGHYHYYAGPVYIYAPSSCIDAYGGNAFYGSNGYTYEGSKYAYDIMCG